LAVISACSFAKEVPAGQKQTHHGQQNILFIGDSHSVGIFGHTLTTLLEESLPDADITTVASCGSTPSWWLNGHIITCGFWRHNAGGSETNSLQGQTPKLDDLIGSVRPRSVIIALGSNMVPLNNKQWRIDTETMMTQVTEKAAQCIWIGPPDARIFSAFALDQVYSVLAELANKHGCMLIDSRKYTRYPDAGGDGLHYGGKMGTPIAKSWAYNVFRHDILPVL
jgi:hypothetical protein